MWMGKGEDKHTQAVQVVLARRGVERRLHDGQALLVEGPELLHAARAPDHLRAELDPVLIVAGQDPHILMASNRDQEEGC